MKSLAPLLLFGASIALFFFVINPSYKDIGVLRGVAKEYKTAIARAEEATTKRDQLVNTYNNISDTDVKKLQQLMPDSVDTIRLIVDMNTMAAKYNASIQNIEVEEEKTSATQESAADAKPYNALNITFSTDMSYDNFLRFLKDLQQNLRLTDVTSINFDSTATGVYTYSVALKTYWLK